MNFAAIPVYTTFGILENEKERSRYDLAVPFFVGFPVFRSFHNGTITLMSSTASGGVSLLFSACLLFAFFATFEDEYFYTQTIVTV